MFNKIFKIWSVSILLVFCLLTSCKDPLEGTTYTTSDEMTVFETLEAEPDRFSMYVEILEKTGFDTSLHSYGNYTSFAPVNDAVEDYIFDRWGVSSVAEITAPEDIEFLRTLVKFHTLNKERKTNSFIEGRITDTTFTSDYLTTSYLANQGIAGILINRSASFDQYDIDAANGVIHALDKVLEPFVKSVVEVMDEAGTHTIFIEALKQTGIYDDFNNLYDNEGNLRRFTLFAESDETYANEGINSFDDLVALISPDDADYTTITNDLNRYVAYHATPSFFYLGDLVSTTMNTVLDKNVIKVTISDDGDDIKINEIQEEDEADNVWTSIVVKDSNYPAKNGVYHTVDKLLTIFVPPAEYKLFDVISEQPEYREKRYASHEKVPQEAWKDIYWTPEDHVIRYIQGSNRLNWDNNFWDAAGFTYCEFTTPTLPVGKYEFLVSANVGNSARARFQMYWDGEPIGAIWDLTKSGNSVGFPDEALMEENGFRRGLLEITDNAGNNGYDTANRMRFIISKELVITTQSTHTIRLETIKAGNSPIDYFEFIPVTE